VLKPPRERPNASRSVLSLDFLSFDPVPCVSLGAHGILRGQVERRRVAGASGVLMGTDHRGVHPHRPLHCVTGLRVLITTAAQLIKDPGPGPIRRPAAMPMVDGLPVPVVTMQIPPRTAGTSPPQHPIDHRSMIGPPPTAHPGAASGQATTVPAAPTLPQSNHGDRAPRRDLPHPTRKIHGTRPNASPAPTAINSPTNACATHCSHPRPQPTPAHRPGPTPRPTHTIQTPHRSTSLRNRHHPPHPNSRTRSMNTTQNHQT
jgi:hypothetical protein